MDRHEETRGQRGTSVQRYNAIPTEYKGALFRSRLEARWAAFFDGIGWEWEYEPIDLSGYIPDFVLPFRNAPLLVEVKPAVDLPTELHQHKSKIERSKWNGEALIVGAHICHLYGGYYLVGLLGERPSVDGQLEWLWGSARMFRCVSCRGTSLMHDDSSWRCRRCGMDDGHLHVAPTAPGLVERAWNEAGTAV